MKVCAREATPCLMVAYPQPYLSRGIAVNGL